MITTKLALILKIIRKHIVAGGFLAFTLGALLALTNGGNFNFSTFVLFYLIVLFGDLSTHYSNDYYDFKGDQITVKSKFFSGKKILVKNPELLPFALKTSVIFTALSIMLACFAVTLKAASIELLLIALAANLLGWMYSAPPIRLISRGFGETAIAIATGFAIPAVGYLSVNSNLDLWFAYFALPFMLYGFMLSLSLQAPDIEADQKGGKNTFSTRKGERFVFAFILSLAFAASLLFILYAWLFESSINLWLIAAFSFVPLTAGLIGFLFVYRRKGLNFFGTINVLSLFMFNTFMVVYLALNSLLTV